MICGGKITIIKFECLSFGGGYHRRTIQWIITIEETAGIPGGREPKNRNSLLVFLVLTAVVLMSMYFMRNIQQGAMEQEVTYTEFEEMVKAGEVESVVIASDRIEIYRKASEETSLEMPFGFDVSQVSYYTGFSRL